MHKFTLETRTATTVFTLLVLAASNGYRSDTPVTPCSHPAASSPIKGAVSPVRLPRVDMETLSSVMNDLLPNKTVDWLAFKDDILRKILFYFDEHARTGVYPPQFSFKPHRGEAEPRPPAPYVPDEKAEELSFSLYKDADVALAAFHEYEKWVVCSH